MTSLRIATYSMRFSESKLKMCAAAATATAIQCKSVREWEFNTNTKRIKMDWKEQYVVMLTIISICVHTITQHTLLQQLPIAENTNKPSYMSCSVFIFKKHYSYIYFGYFFFWFTFHRQSVMRKIKNFNNSVMNPSVCVCTSQTHITHPTNEQTFIHSQRHTHTHTPG